MIERRVAGERLGDFQLGERIHSGGMGHVYRVTPAQGPGPGFPLCVKVPGVGRGEPAVGIVGFEMELMIQPTLSGEHVPRFVAAGDLHNPYLVMEWIEGESLAKRIEAAPLVEDEVAAIGAAIADALHEIHGQQVVHHDLKPENVLLRADGTAVLIDFGFAFHARFPDLLGEEMHFAAGSAAYVSPEQMRNLRGDSRSDIFSLGALLYQLATRETPFGAPATIAGMRDRLWRVPAPPRALKASITPWLQEVILRCLETDPAARYQSAAHVAFDLRNTQRVSLSPRAHITVAPGFTAQLGRWWRARDVLGSPPPSADRPRAPVILVAVDTVNLDDPRHPSIQWTTRQVLSLNAEYRLMCVSVVAEPGPGIGDEPFGESGRQLEHLGRLRRWVEPLGLPPERLSLHVLQAPDPSSALLSLARRNHVDLIVLGAPGPDSMTLAWWRSVASSVTANAHCSVHVVRVAENSRVQQSAQANEDAFEPLE